MALPVTFGAAAKVSLPIARDESAKLVIETHPALLTHAQEKLSCNGVLKQAEDGFVYLKIDNRFIHDLFPLISAQGMALEEPKYFEGGKSAGAHVSIITRQEKEVSQIGFISELGKEISFKITHFAYADYKVQNSVKRVYYLLIDAAELQGLRQNYGLTPKKDEREFHITLAIARPR